MKIKNPVKWKIIILVAAVFMLGAATAVVNYAHGSEVIEGGDHINMVSHTEYRYSEPGQIIVRIVNFQGDPISVTNCTASILYPNKTYFAQDQLMAASTISGDHYYNFTTPVGPEGVYEYQAVCNYPPGKVATATNSFHLSSALSTIISDLTAINGTIVDFQSQVQSNVTQILDAIESVNVTAEVGELTITIGQINVTVNDMQTNLNEFIVNVTGDLVDIDTNIEEINVTTNNIYNDLVTLNTTMITQFGDITTILSGNFSDILSNLTDLRALIINMNTSLFVELNSIHTDLLSINTSIINKIDAINLSITTDISNFQQEVQANFSVVNNWLDFINSTTVSTYDYVTGTLATNVNNVLTTLGVINATVNRIETNVSQILQNQEDEVYINTFSG